MKGERQGSAFQQKTERTASGHALMTRRDSRFAAPSSFHYSL